MSFSTTSTRSPSICFSSSSMDHPPPSPRLVRSQILPNTADDRKIDNVSLKKSWSSEIADRLKPYGGDVDNFIDVLVPCSTDHPFVVAANPIPEEPFEEYRPSKNVLEVKTYPGLVRVSSTFQLYDAFSDHPCCRLLV